MPAPLPPSALLAVAGIGLRNPHVAELLERRPTVGWLEVHAENYMNRGPGALALERLAGHYPLSVHGVGLSLGTARGIDRDHLNRLKEVCDRFEPRLVSEHMAWSVGDGIYLNDLLPLPHDEEALRIVCRNIDLAQSVLKRRILVENLSAYVGFTQSTMSEPEFLNEIVKRTGCGLLLDINNVYVSAHNIGLDPYAYVAALPAEAIGEIHLAGHAENDTPDGSVLIDDHGSRVAPPVWSLYSFAVRRLGLRPTLIEWDTAIPPLETLLGEAMWADLLSGSIAFGRKNPPLVADLRGDTPRKVKVASCDHRGVAPAAIRNIAQREAIHA
jgi:uncharacterized protein (UPF0276 family)